MSFPDDAQRIARDFIVAVSDRRLELDGARWRQLEPETPASAEAAKLQIEYVQGERPAIELVPRLPASFLDHAPPADVANLSFSCRVSQLLHYSVLPLRWEPLNYTALHRGVASAGGLFATDTCLVCRHKGAWRTLLVSPDDVKLVDVGEAAPLRTDGEIELTVMARLDRLVPGYADFSVCLAGLEGGMILAQMLLLGQRLRLRLAISTAAPAPMPKGPLDWPLFTLSILTGETSALDDMDSGISMIALPVARDQGKAKLPAVRDLLKIGARPVQSRRGSAQHDVLPPADFDLFVPTMHRSSGRVDGEGRSGAALGSEGAVCLFTHALAYHRQLPTLICRDALVCSLAILDPLAGNVMVFTLDIQNGSSVQRAASPEMAAAVRATCTGEFTALFSLGVATGEMVDLIASGDVLTLYAAGGQFGHCLCLAAAKLQAIARPYRAMPDAMMNLLLPAQTRGILQIMVGFDARPNPSFLLG